MEKVLVLGGTHFIGRNLMEALLHNTSLEVTLFNRGVTNSHLFPNTPKLKGDRYTTDIQKIKDQEWDVVIDLSCYYPKGIQNITEILAPSLKNYIFISTCSVYDNDRFKGTLRSESSPILKCSPQQEINTTDASYGNRKAECERILQRSGLRHTILRPALVYGPYDTTDRLYYYLYAVNQSEEIILANGGRDRFSLTYVKDLVTVITQLIQMEGKGEIYNAVSHPTSSISSIIEEAEKNIDTKANNLLSPSSKLHDLGVQLWNDLPLWLDSDTYTYNNKYLKNNLNFEPTRFSVSIQHTIRYYTQLNWPSPKFGMSKLRKSEILHHLRS